MTELETEFYQQFLEPGDYTRPPWLRGSGPAIHNSWALQLFMLMSCQSRMTSTAVIPASKEDLGQPVGRCKRRCKHVHVQK